MRMFLTGAIGRIGQEIASNLLDAGHCMVGLTPF